MELNDLLMDALIVATVSWRRRGRGGEHIRTLGEILRDHGGQSLLDRAIVQVGRQVGRQAAEALRREWEGIVDNR